jgi:hypothetical protein
VRNRRTGFPTLTRAVEAPLVVPLFIYHKDLRQKTIHPKFRPIRRE